VREVNASLPVDRQLRVLLGDTPSIGARHEARIASQQPPTLALPWSSRTFDYPAHPARICVTG
jgi:hypothetical protein